MLNGDSLGERGPVGHMFPDGVDVRTVEIASAVPAPAPDVLGSGLEIQLVALFLHEQSVVRTVPRTVLRVRSRVVREAAEPRVTTDGGKVAPRRMNDVEYFLEGESEQRAAWRHAEATHFVVRKLDTWDHDDATVARGPVVVANERNTRTQSTRHRRDAPCGSGHAADGR